VLDQGCDPSRVRLVSDPQAEAVGPGDLGCPLRGLLAGEQDFAEHRSGHSRRCGGALRGRGPTSAVDPIMKLRGAQAVSFCEALQPEVPFPVPTHPLFPIRPRNAFPPMSVPFLVHPAILARRLPPRTDVLRLPLTFNLDPALLTETQLRDYFLFVKLQKHWKPKSIRQALAAARQFFVDLRWNQQLGFHPHIHCLVPGAGLDTLGRFVRVKQPDFLVHLPLLQAAFRRHLHRLFQTHDWEVDPDVWGRN
jgi:hypothetical protein